MFRTMQQRALSRRRHSHLPTLGNQLATASALIVLTAALTACSAAGAVEHPAQAETGINSDRVAAPNQQDLNDADVYAEDLISVTTESELTAELTVNVEDLHFGLVLANDADILLAKQNGWNVKDGVVVPWEPGDVIEKPFVIFAALRIGWYEHSPSNLIRVFWNPNGNGDGLVFDVSNPELVVREYIADVLIHNRPRGSNWLDPFDAAFLLDDLVTPEVEALVEERIAQGTEPQEWGDMVIVTRDPNGTAIANGYTIITKGQNDIHARYNAALIRTQTRQDVIDLATRIGRENPNVAVIGPHGELLGR